MSKGNDLILKYACGTNVGRVRSLNEDSFKCLPEKKLFLVADGMGGHAAGEVASQMAVEVVADYHFNGDGQMPEDKESKTPSEEFLIRSIKEANNSIFQKAKDMESNRGMGTTIVGVKIEKNVAHVAHVGDSRVYLFRDGKLTLLTNDHSWVNFQVMIGNITKEQARFHPLKNIITKALGIQEDIDVDLNMVKIQPNDFILLCSDGLTGLVHDDVTQEVLSKNNGHLQASVDELIQMALDNGGDDNVTVVLIHVQQRDPHDDEDEVTEILPTY